MTILKIRTYPDPVLKHKTSKVEAFDSELHKLLDDMADTMYDAPGIGLAAPQVGVLKRVAVIDVSENKDSLIELINPNIVAKSGETSSEEGCLSIPEYRDIVARAKEIELEAFDRRGVKFTLKAEELFAICCQHEIDHLDGVLFVDRLSYLKREMFKKWFRKHGDSS